MLPPIPFSSPNIENKEESVHTLVETPKNSDFSTPSFLENAQYLANIVPIEDTQLINAPTTLWASHPKGLPFASIFPATVHSRHLIDFYKAILKFRSGKINAVKIGVMGDSIFAPASDMIAPTENATYSWMMCLREAYPDVIFIFKNCAIGGTTWEDMWSDNTPPPGWMNPTTNIWKTSVAEESFHLLLLHSAGNDVNRFSPISVNNLIFYFKSLKNPPSIIVGLSYMPSKSSTISNAYQQYWTQEYQSGLNHIIRWLRGFCLKNDLGFLDFYRWKSMIVEGFDPEDMALEQIIPSPCSTLPAFGVPVPSATRLHETSWSFPNVKNTREDFANECTDFFIAYSFDSNPETITINLSSQKKYLPHVISDNNFHLIFNDNSGKISYSWSDGIENKFHNKFITDILIPEEKPFFLNVMAKGNQVIVKIWIPLSNTEWYPGDLVAMGVGFTTIFAGIIPRFGSPYTPVLSWTNSEARCTIYNLCIGNQLSVRGGGRRYMPWMTDLTPMERSSTTGGSNAYHLNAYGTRDILSHVFRHQQWAMPPRGIEEQIFQY